MAITAAVRQDIMELAVLMNNKAPGTALLSELVAKSAAGASLTEIAEHLAGRAEFKAQYPTFQTATEFANEWLGNALPEASAALLAEAVTIVEAHINGGGSVPALVIEVQKFMTDPANADGAVKTHIDNFTNKVTVATYHTITKEAVAEWEIPSTVTSDATTVATANVAVDVATAPAAAASVTKNLTIASDIIKGGSGDDVFNATRAGALGTTNTYQANDQLDGGEGSDSLYIESAIAVNLATQKSIEKISVNAVGAAVAVTLPTDNAYTNLESSSSTHNVSFNNIRNGDVDAAITSQANTFTTTLNYFGTALTGASDNLDVTLSGADGDLDITGGNAANKLETLTLNSISDGTLDDIDLANASTTKLVVTGSGSTTIGGISNAAATLNVIDASAATGAVSVTGVNTTANTITGGAGNDTLAGAAGNDTISSGKGEDQITDAAGNDSISMGAGNDTFVIATATGVNKNDTVDGGEGTDTIQLTGTLDYSTAGAGTDDSSGIKGFEVLSSGGTVAQDMTGLAANNTITSASIGAHSVTLTKDTAIADVTFTGNGALTMATAGTQTVTLAGDTGGTAIPNDVQASLTSGSTAVNLVSAGSDAGGDNTLTLAGTALTSITVTGSEDVDVSVTKSKLVSSVDFSGSTAEEVQFAGLTTNTAAITYKTADGTQTSALTTGAGADTITLGSMDDTVSNAGDGDNVITAGAGNDIITLTGKGNDTITLGEGDTQSVGNSGAGNDTITGGAGNDTVTNAGAGDDTITLGDGNDVVSDAGAGNDIIDGGAGNDNLSGGSGDDSITGGAGNDTLADGTGNDTVIGGDGVDTITITTGNDNIDAGAGNDIISITGLSGADTIDGGADTDSITITNSSAGTLTPAFTNIESAIVNTSSDFVLSLTAATDKTSLTSYTIASTDDTAADAVTITDGANNTVVNLSDDNSWDGLAAADNTGDVGAVKVGTTAGGTITLNVGANEDALVHTGTSLASLEITKSAVANITSSNTDTNKIQNALTSLKVDNAETQTVNLTANANAGLTVGNVNTVSAGVSSLVFSTASNAASTIGTMVTATGLQTLDYNVTGGSSSAKSSTFVAGVVGETTAAQLTSLNAQVTGAGSTMTLDSVDTASSTAITSINLKANSANSVLTLATGHAGTTTTMIDAGSATVASLNITAADNASLLIDDANANATITSGAITSATVSLGNYATFADVGGNSNDNLVITGAPTTLNISLGRDLTHAANDEILFSGTTTTLNLTSTLDDDNIAFNNNEQISYGGNVLVDLAGVTKANYTHTGSGTFSWDGTNVTGAQVIKAAASESTTGGITGGAGNDNLTGNEGAQTITGNGGNDTISGLGGNDSLVGGAGNDNIASGDGADTVSGGLGTDGINISGASAADVIQISAGAVGTATDNESEDIAGTSATVVDDRGEDTITGFDAGNDTIHVTATNVLAFDHTANLAVSAPANAGISTTTTGTLNSFVKNTLFVSLDADTDYDDDDDVVVTFADFSLNGVDQLAASATDYLTVADVSGRIQYTLTGTAAANVIVAGDLADTITGGGAADTVTLGTGADRFYYTFTAKASLATESGAAAGTDNDFAAGTIGDSITGFVSGTDKIYFATAALDNGTESQTLKVITNGGTIANNDVFVRVSTDAANAEMGTAIALLNGLITTTIAQTENIVVAIETTTDTYLYYVEQASTADTIAAADTTLIAKLVGVTAIADGDLVFA